MLFEFRFDISYKMNTTINHYILNMFFLGFEWIDLVEVLF